QQHRKAMAHDAFDREVAARAQALLGRVGEGEPVERPGDGEDDEDRPGDDEPERAPAHGSASARRRSGGNRAWLSRSITVSSSRMKSSRESPGGIGGRTLMTTWPGLRMRPFGFQISPVLSAIGVTGMLRSLYIAAMPGL